MSADLYIQRKCRKQVKTILLVTIKLKAQTSPTPTKINFEMSKTTILEITVAH